MEDLGDMIGGMTNAMWGSFCLVTWRRNHLCEIPDNHEEQFCLPDKWRTDTRCDIPDG